MHNPSKEFQVRYSTNRGVSYSWEDRAIAVGSIEELEALVKGRKAKEILEKLVFDMLVGTPHLEMRNFKYRFKSFDVSILKIEFAFTLWDVAMERTQPTMDSLYTLSIME